MEPRKTRMPHWALALLGMLCACAPPHKPLRPDDDGVIVQMQGVIVRRYRQGRLELQARADRVLLFRKQERLQARQVMLQLEGN